MVSPNDKAPCLDADLAAFVQGGVSIVAASRVGKRSPVIARAAGCRVSPSRRQVTLLVASSQAAAFLEGIRNTRAIAAVFSQPSTHRTIQLKGTDAAPAPLQDGDHALIAAYTHAFCEELAPLGYHPDQVRAVLSCEADDFVAVTFTISTAFSQTPGPRAGEPLVA